MNDKPTLRPAQADEIALLQAIDQAARSRYAGVPGFDYASSSAPIGAERLANGETVVAELGGTLVGFVLSQPLDGMMYLANISVRPGAGRMGVGAALLRHVVDRTLEDGMKAVTLTTFKAPPWNGPWFRRHGFLPMPDAHIGPGLRAVLNRQATFLDMATRETLWKLVGE
jgi:N-acetylglutamate synthase-like GNAT family acetyltransferase